MTESEENVERTEDAAATEPSSTESGSTEPDGAAGSAEEETEQGETGQGETVDEAPATTETAAEEAEEEAAAAEEAGTVSPEERRRRILVDVAAGTLDPNEASRLLDELGKASESGGTGAADSGDAAEDPAADTAGAVADEEEEDEDDAADPWSAATDDVAGTRRSGTRTAARPVAPGTRQNGSSSTGSTGSTGTAGSENTSGRTDAPPSRLRIRTMGRRVRVIGEPFVKTVSIDGPHVVRTEDDTLVVTSEGEIGASVDGFTLLRTRSLRDVQEQVFDFGRELSVRVNPNLIVEVEVTAGSLNAERLPSLEHVRITAGSGRLRDVSGPIDLLVQAGSATVEGVMTRGTSRLRAESGSLQLHLMPGSDVSIRSDAQLGRIGWDRDTGEKERVFGAGTAHLDLEVMMGNIQVKEA